jgi:hypothetical protein
MRLLTCSDCQGSEFHSLLGSLTAILPLLHQTENVYLSTMNVSLNDYVLFHLIKFVDPVDRFNLLLSGIVKGFESVNEGLDLRQRYFEHFSLVQCAKSVNLLHIQNHRFYN